MKKQSLIMKQLFGKALVTDKGAHDHRDDFFDLFGVWTEADEEQFLEATRDFEAVHPEDWK
jgi:hypothetical protein